MSGNGLADGVDYLWSDPGVLRDGDLELRVGHRVRPDPRRGYLPLYRFYMYLRGRTEKVGYIDLRVGHTHRILMYAGHIGYGVEPGFRGGHLAARSCRLLFPFAKKLGLNPLWITCNPENLPSRRTCEIAGGTLVETVDLPKSSDFYRAGDRQKCRYRFDL